MKKALSFILSILMLTSSLSLLASAADKHSGITFERTETNGINHPVGYYNTEKRYEKMPITFEAWVYVPKNVYSSRCGAILGNYQSFAKDVYVNFEIHSNGVPRLVFGDNAGNMYDYKFSRAPVPADKWTHVAIVYGTGTDGKQISCYINGQFKQKTAVKEWYSVPDEVRDNMICLAGDYRALNEQAFRGTLGDVWVYSDIRSDAEILSDYQNGPDLADGELMMFYELSKAQPKSDIPDASGNGYDMTYSRFFLTENEMNAIRAEDEYEYEYALAFLPDIQYMTQSYPGSLQIMIDYLVEKGKTKNIQYVLGLGDITNSNTDKEWSTILRQTNRLNGYLPYALTPGNHDGINSGGKEVLDNIYAKKTGHYYQLVEKNGGFFNKDSVRNTYHTFTVGEVDFLVIALDFGATDDILAWAGELLNSHPNHRAIILTHGYLNSDGTTLDSNDYASPDTYVRSLNSGEDIWEKLVSKHENIAMIVSGHMHHDTIVVTPREGDAGNTVYQILMDPQSTCKKLGGLGAIGMMYFTADGNHAKVEYYSTVFEKYFAESNKAIKLTFGKDEPEETTAPETEVTTEAPTESTDTEAIVEESGCSGIISAASVTLVLLFLPVFLNRKKYES
ncbi:MAG: metallophosphoesterase [Clostridia bacterium]|nr:metallophosphoesterase [Clostridia bacterium]